jgi:hypothetical protein
MLRRVLAAALLGLLLLVEGAALFVAQNLGDAPTVDDADLRVARPVVLPGDSASPVLQEAVAHLVWDPSVPAGPPDGPLARLALLTRPNGVGRWSVEFGHGSDVRREARRCRSDAAVASTGVLVALRAYQVEHGALPGSLDALVPEEISAIPESAMGGKPIRYSRGERKLCIDDACAKDAVAIPF